MTAYLQLLDTLSSQRAEKGTKAYEEQERAANQNHWAWAVSAANHRSHLTAGANRAAFVVAVLRWPPFILCSLPYLLRLLGGTKAGTGEKGDHQSRAPPMAESQVFSHF